MDNFNVDIEQIAKHYNRDLKTLQNWASVNRKVPFSRRRELLDFGHHECVAALDAKSQDYWLGLAAQGEGEGDQWRRWSVKELRDAIRKSRRGAYSRPTSTLANKSNRRLLMGIWSAVEHDKPVSRDEILALRRWLIEVERRLVDKTPAGVQELEYVDEDTP